MSDPIDSVLIGVKQEVDRQVELWGVQNHPDGTRESYTDIARNAKDRCDRAIARGELSYLDILAEEFWEVASETDPDKLIVELTQVAAVAASWIAAIERRNREAR